MCLVLDIWFRSLRISLLRLVVSEKLLKTSRENNNQQINWKMVKLPRNHLSIASMFEWSQTKLQFLPAKKFVWLYFLECHKCALLVVVLLVVFEFWFGLNQNAEPTRSIFKCDIIWILSLKGVPVCFSLSPCKIRLLWRSRQSLNQ